MAKSRKSPTANQTTLTILGSGTSVGVPVIGCTCQVCRSRNPRNKRLRASVLFQTRGKTILIDTSPDLRAQALREKMTHVDAVLFTHPHADHIQGIDEIRAFNFLQKQVIPAYGNAWTCEELPDRFPYIFRPTGPVEGGGIPQLDLNLFDAGAPQLTIAGIPVVPIPVMHGSKECVGYRIDSVAYVTDCSYIPPTSLERMKELSVLVLDCLRIIPHRTHLNLDQALEVIRQVRPKKTYLTHLGHEFDYAEWAKKLPKGVALAYDGLKIRGETT